MKRFTLLFTLVILATPIAAEAPPSVAMLGLFYNGMKARVVDEGIRTKFAEIDVAIGEAYRGGQSGEVRRHLSRGLSLAAGRGWGARQEYEASLTARTDDAFLDPVFPLTVRLSQLFPVSPPVDKAAPQMVLSIRFEDAPLRARIVLHEPPRNFFVLGNKLREIADIGGLSTDLIETPMVHQLDISDIEDGNYQLRVEIYSGDRNLGSSGTPLFVRRGLSERVAALRAVAREANDDVEADILYPLDMMRKISHDILAADGFDVDAELSAAEAIAQEKNPFKNKKGDFERHYFLEGSEEIMPYRVYVPESYKKGKRLPLIIALHGLGGTEDTMFARLYGMKPLAEERGYLMAAPMGFRPDGGYGAMGSRNTHRGQMSEQDVMNVLSLMRDQYSVDEDRIYLMGHSMGAIGTWSLAEQYPDQWAALGPIAGMGNPAATEVFKHIPQIVVHGTADNTVPVAGSRAMVDALKLHEANVTYIEVPGGGHTNIAPMNMSKIFDFFDAHRRES